HPALDAAPVTDAAPAPDAGGGGGFDPDAPETADSVTVLPLPYTVRVTLAAQSGVSGVQRVNFAVPLPPATLTDVNRTLVQTAAGVELRAARRALATFPDGSLRSIQLQVDVDPAVVTAVDVRLGVTATAAPLALAEVSTTLVIADGTSGPRVWAYLPVGWMAISKVTGPIIRRSVVAGTALDAWQSICDYAAFGTSAFLPVRGTASYWLFDRPTALFRGYAYSGAASALRDAYREAALYRGGISGTDSATRIGVPGASSDLKYHYTQGMAIHYLLTGDTRFREAAENVAVRAHDLWTDPGYAGGADFWTERHAGFALLAYEWASAVSDDRAATFRGWSDTAVTAYAAMQDNAAAAWESDARCFAHTGAAHGESYAYVGCSPWMSAILADGLEAYARRTTGTRRTVARTALVELGRMIARHGRDSTGKPYYWMGAGVNAGEVDDYDEHWGESAYVVAMAWFYQGKTDAQLRAAADALVSGTRTLGEAGQLRSFNWQCRSAVATPYFLR
ncbi:MAG: hypothetical protein K8M05_12250, partial [Deltaproteobacteria bacterium]|nr:hypothetical protein [Kofleriaceae bacterium]